MANSRLSTAWRSAHESQYLLTKACATAAAAVLLLGAVPGVAHAGENAQACVSEPNGDHIACAFFNADPNPEQLVVCDYRADGHEAVGTVRWGENGVIREDDRAASSSCDTRSLTLAEGTPIEVRVCIPDLDRCSRWRSGRA
jgi:hypothetical protein